MPCTVLITLLLSIVGNPGDAGLRDTDMILVKAQVRGVEGIAVLDTGSNATAVDSSEAQKLFHDLKFKEVQTQRPIGITSTKEYADVPHGLAVGVTSTTNVLTMDLSSASITTGFPVSYLIGHEVTRHLRIQVTRDSATVSTGPFSMPDAQSRIPLIVNSRSLAEVSCTFPYSVQRHFVIDTGCAWPLAVHRRFVDSLVRTGNASIVRTGEAAPGQSGTVVVLRDFVVAGIHMQNVVAEVAEMDCIGLPMLQELEATLDFPNNQMLVPKTNKRGRDWWPIDASGLRIVRREDRLTRVRRIVPGSSAEKSGFHVDDIIHAIDGTPALDLARYEVEERLAKAGTSVTLDVQRGDLRLTVELPLSHPFEYPPKWEAKSRQDDDFINSLDEK